MKYIKNMKMAILCFDMLWFFIVIHLMCNKQIVPNANIMMLSNSVVILPSWPYSGHVGSICIATLSKSWPTAIDISGAINVKVNARETAVKIAPTIIPL